MNKENKTEKVKNDKQITIFMSRDIYKKVINFRFDNHIKTIKRALEILLERGLENDKI